MKEKTVPPLQTPKKRHQNQMLVQVWLPLAVILAVVIGLMVWVIFLAGGQPVIISQAADVSLILMILPIFLTGLAGLILIILFLVLTARLTKSIPLLGAKLHLFILRVQLACEKVTTALTKPVIHIQSGSYAARQSFFRKNRK